jgi:hypothetical protein
MNHTSVSAPCGCSDVCVSSAWSTSGAEQGGIARKQAINCRSVVEREKLSKRAAFCVPRRSELWTISCGGRADRAAAEPGSTTTVPRRERVARSPSRQVVGRRPATDASGSYKRPTSHIRTVPNNTLTGAANLPCGRIDAPACGRITCAYRLPASRPSS